MSFVATGIGLGVGALGVAGKAISRSKSNKKLQELLNQAPKYKNQSGLAQTLLNARAPGAAEAERNVYQQEANQMAGAQRAATSGNELLLAGAGATGQANQAFSGINQAEMADYQRRYGNLTAAQQADYEAAQQLYGQKAQIQGAIQENRANTWGDVAGLGFATANMAANGAFTKAPTTPPDISSVGKAAKTPVITAYQAARTAAPSANTSLPTTQIPYNWLNSSYPKGQNPNIPSNFLSRGYNTQQRPYSNIPRNVFSGGYDNPYGGDLYENQ